MTELLSSYDFSWLPMLDSPVGESMIGEVMWPNVAGVPIIKVAQS